MTFSTTESVNVLAPTVRRESICWWLAVLPIALLAAGRLWWLPAHAPLNVNEGWNAGQVMRVAGIGSLYPNPDALVANNYPPLSFVLLGILRYATGDVIVTGRVLALLAQVATGAAICAIVAKLAPGRLWPTVAALLFGAYSVTLLRPYLAINDPQWLGHAAMGWGMLCVVPTRAGEVPTLGRIVLAAALMVVGGLIKHNLVAVPIATTLWMAVLGRRALLAWMASGAAMVTIACAALLATWGEVVFVDVLAPARSYSLARMLAKGGPLLPAMAPVLLACRPLLARWRRDPRLALPLLLLGFAIPIGIVQRAGSGVDVNAFSEAIIAAVIAVPVSTALRPGRALGWIGISLLPALCLVPSAAAADLREFRARDAAVQNAATFVTAIAAATGTVACDDQAICYWAGRESAIDFFSVQQRLLQGRAIALAPTLAEGRFELIQMRSDNPGWHQNLLIPAIRVRYAPIYRADGSELLVPRTRIGNIPRPQAKAVRISH